MLYFVKHCMCVKFFCLGDELMLRPSIRGLYFGESRSHPGKVLWFRPQNKRLVLSQLASYRPSSSSWSCGTWTGSSRRSGCRWICGGGGGRRRRSRTSTPMMVMFTAREPKGKLRKEKGSKWNAIKNMDDNGGSEQELTHWSLES